MLAKSGYHLVFDAKLQSAIVVGDFLFCVSIISKVTARKEPVCIDDDFVVGLFKVLGVVIQGVVVVVVIVVILVILVIVVFFLR